MLFWCSLICFMLIMFLLRVVVRFRVFSFRARIRVRFTIAVVSWLCNFVCFRLNSVCRLLLLLVINCIVFFYDLSFVLYVIF